MTVSARSRSLQRPSPNRDGRRGNGYSDDFGAAALHQGQVYAKGAAHLNDF
jgi:hypothetical protein